MTPAVVMEWPAFVVEAQWQDEVGNYYFTSSDWLFITVRHQPVFIRLDALQWKPWPRDRRGNPDVAFVGLCTQGLYGNANPYAPPRSVNYPSAWFFTDATGESVKVTPGYDYIQPEVGHLYTVYGRLGEVDGNPVVDAYRLELVR